MRSRPRNADISPLDGKIRVDLAPASEDDAGVAHLVVDLAVDSLDGGVPSSRNVGGDGRRRR